MPSFEQYSIYPPTDSAEFESMVLDYFRLFYADKVQPYGRRGQRQGGIDLYIDNADGSIIGIQCKDYIKRQITQQNVAEIVALAETFPVSLSQLIIAVANNTDAKIQEYVSAVNQNRRQNEKFGVGIIFWESIISKIKENQNIFYKYYSRPFFHNDIFQECGPVENEEEMFNRFVEIILNNKVLEYLRCDIFVGLSWRIIESMEQYNKKIIKLLDRASKLMNTDTYKKICVFYSCLESYQNDASVLCQANWNYEMFQAVSDSEKWEEMNKRRLELLQIYTNICTSR